MNKSVFISHSTEDSTVAEEICSVLEAEGISCWIAPRDVTSARPFVEQIIDAIEGTRITVLVLSRYANDSRYVRQELQHAFDRDRMVIPFRIEEVEPARAIGLFLGGIQWIDAWNPPRKQRIKYLAQTVKNIINDFDVPLTPPTAVPFPPAPPEVVVDGSRDAAPSGAETAPEEPPAELVCQKCGHIASPGQRFCSGCGAQLVAPALVPEPPSEEAFVESGDVEPAPEELPAELVCQQCGVTLAPGHQFCSGCGAQLAGALVPVPPAPPPLPPLPPPVPVPKVEPLIKKQEPRRRKPRWLIPAIAGAALIVIAGAVLAAVLLTRGAEAGETTTSSSTSTSAVSSTTTTVKPTTTTAPTTTTTVKPTTTTAPTTTTTVKPTTTTRRPTPTTHQPATTTTAPGPPATFGQQPTAFGRG